MGNGPVAQTTHCAMGTVMTHKAFGLHAEEGLEAVCREVARIEALLSRFLPDSEISRVNRSAVLRAFPRTEAILVDTDLSVYLTHGLRTRFQAAKGIEVTILD
jgi:hypothetical protein